YWWQHVLRADPLYRAIGGLSRCLVTSRVSTHHAFRFEPTGRLFNDKVFAFAFDSYAAFSILQSTVHAAWSLENSSRLAFAINYSISKTFATFPFPSLWESSTALSASGEKYYLHRDSIMVRFDIGLTSAYNRFHDPDDSSEDMRTLRDL